MQKPRQDIRPNTAEYETLPLVKPTGFREYDARWILEKEINLLGIQALGLGLAAPFVLFAFVPSLLRVLPKPGPWMDVFRQALAFPMFASVIWLVWVLSIQAGSAGVLFAGAAMVALGLAIWANNHSGAIWKTMIISVALSSPPGGT